MKNILLKLMVFTALVSFNACDEFLDVESKSTMDGSVVYSSPEFAQQAVGGILTSFAETNSYRGRYLVNYGVNTDVEITNSFGDYTGPKGRIANYNTQTQSPGVMESTPTCWAKLYEGVERANIAVENLRAYGDVENRPEMAQILGEVLTLRAVIYNDLLKAWGNVPARFSPITPETIYEPKSDRDVILKQLLDDLAEAAEYCAWPGETAVTQTREHVNKAFVKGLRARLALIAAGYSQHIDGQYRESAEFDKTELYQIAKTECLDVINSGTCRLLGFEEVFKNYYCGENLTAVNNEILFEIPFSEGRGRVIFDLGVKHTNTDKYTGQAKGGTDGVNPVMWYEYEKEDVRREVSCVPYEWTNGKQVPTNLNKWYFGKYRYEWLPRRVTSSNDDGLNWLYMRYSDILLMAAEAINELEGLTAAAPYFREVRERAYPNNPEKVDAYMAQITASKNAFFNAIVDERALEFCGEMVRKADLIRWNLLTEKMAENKEKLQQLSARQGKYADLPQKIYYKTAPDGESLIIYGLNFGDTDATGEALRYPSNKSWEMFGGETTEDKKIWNCLFMRDPELQPYWPVFDVDVANSNGTLTNDGYNHPAN
ncbi:MAG: RagB/SusD family nutrient uptake outer membrane protein [Prolixibacteraceae bacterium]|jgi:hypothetical protein|nr:RagB/SusD family nutrient uptake outer membrane protein [Prolixibacteraceae bacterium]